MRKKGEAHTVALKSGEIRCVIRRRKNQKYINLRITLQGELMVSAPYGVGIERITESLRSKERWISRNMEKIAASRSDTDPLKHVYLHGVRYAVRVVRDPLRTRSLRLDRDARSVEIRTKAPTRAQVERILENFLIRQAKRTLPARAAEMSTLTKIPFQKLFIRNQRTRWGSSSGRGNISFNWRAIMLPKEVQDYLIVHELAHQIHLNHSKAFWDTVAIWCPNYPAANKWLRDHSTFIALFRR